jgi:hypothetical protein
MGHLSRPIDAPSPDQPEQDRPAMSSKVVNCTHAECGEPAVYKIAAPWSDGVFSELKSFGLACADHLGVVFRLAEARRKVYHPTEGEKVGNIGIYKFESGKRDRQLQRLAGLEENYRS